MEKITAKPDVFKMFVASLQVSVDIVEELEDKIRKLEQDHGMEPGLSAKITGVTPKYTKTITNLVDVNRKLRKELEESRQLNDKLEEEIMKVLARMHQLEDRLNAKNISPGYTPV